MKKTENELHEAEEAFIHFHSMITSELERLAKEKVELERELGNIRVRASILERTLFGVAKIIGLAQKRDNGERTEFETIMKGGKHGN